MARRENARFLALEPREGLRGSDVADIIHEIGGAAERIRALSERARGDVPRFMAIRLLAGTLDHEAERWAANMAPQVDGSAAFRHIEGGRA